MSESVWWQFSTQTHIFQLNEVVLIVVLIRIWTACAVRFGACQAWYNHLVRAIIIKHYVVCGFSSLSRLKLCSSSIRMEFLSLQISENFKGKKRRDFSAEHEVIKSMIIRNIMKWFWKNNIYRKLSWHDWDRDREWKWGKLCLRWLSCWWKVFGSNIKHEEFCWAVEWESQLCARAIIALEWVELAEKRFSWKKKIEKVTFHLSLGRKISEKKIQSIFRAVLNLRQIFPRSGLLSENVFSVKNFKRAQNEDFPHFLTVFPPSNRTRQRAALIGKLEPRDKSTNFPFSTSRA